MADIRNCEQCATPFAPRREHARFCSARCRVAWNRRHGSGAPADTSALDWSITAMKDTIDRLCRASGWDQADAFAMISEAVWRVTIVDAALMRSHPESYSQVLGRQDPSQRRITEETFAGLRFVCNRMDYHTQLADFIQPLDPGLGVAAWTWKSLTAPGCAGLTPRGQDWEMTRYQAYQAQLAHHAVGQTFTQTTAFLGIAAEGILSRV